MLRPLITPLNLQRRNLKRVLLAATVALILLLLLLPIMLSQLIHYQVPRMGLGQIEIGKLSINPFRGRLQLDEVSLYRSAARVFFVKHAEIDLAMLSLSDRRFHLQSLYVDGLQLTMKQDVGEVWHVAGIALPGRGEGEASVPIVEAGEKWLFGIDDFRLVDSDILFIHPQFPETIHINAIDVGPLAQWRPDYVTPFKFNLALRDGEVKLEALGKPFSPKPGIQCQLEVDELPLSRIGKLASPYIKGMKGRLSTAMQLEVEMGENDAFSLHQQGTFSIAALQASYGNAAISQKKLHWDGSVDTNDIRDKSALRIKGQLVLNEVGLALQGEAARTITLNHAAVDDLTLSGTSRVEIGGVTLDKLVAASSDKGPALSLSQLSMHGFTMEGAERMTLNEAILDGIVATSETKEPVLSVKKVALNNMVVSDSNQLAIGEIALDEVVASTVRTAHGVAVAGLPEGGENAGKGETVTAAGTSTTDKTTKAEPFQFRVDRVHLQGQSRITFTDQTVKPPFRNTIILTQGELKRLDSSKPEQVTQIALKGKNDEYATFSLEGESRPFAPTLDMKIKARVGTFDMPPTSPYLAKLLGYRINTGQLNSDVKLQVANNTIDGEIDLKLVKLQLKRVDPQSADELEDTTGVPLNTALSMLRDKDDNIKLRLPISGNLDDPKFNFNDVINTALSKALKTGTVSYLKHLLQPYSSLITVVQLAGKAGGMIQLDPILFDIGKASLQPTAIDYLGRLQKLMSEKGIAIQICAYATTSDLIALSKGKETVIPQAGHTVLEELARQRGEAIKSHLVTVYGIKPGLLLLCHPELDRAAGGLPRVELNI